MPIIVFAIKSFFFSGANSYSFGWKIHTFHFFLLFYGKMLRVICAIFAIAIEDLKVQFGDSNLLLDKSVIRFKPFPQVDNQ